MPKTASANVSGTIFSSICGGSDVNKNLYDEIPEAFLNGGPQNCSGGAGLPDGTYYFQVTDPSAKTLLSTDNLDCREVTVSGGVISSYVDNSGTDATCAGKGGGTDCFAFVNEEIDETLVLDAGTHLVSAGSCPGSIGVQLAPFDVTPNGGGVYKVWLTPTSALAQGCDVKTTGASCAENFGFIDATSKTDNFRIRFEAEPPFPGNPVLGEIDSLKFCDANANGILDPAELVLGLSGWDINASGPNSYSQTRTTGAGGVAPPFTDLLPGTYTVTETGQAGFTQTAGCANGFCGTCNGSPSTLCNLDIDCAGDGVPSDTCKPDGAVPPLVFTGSCSNNAAQSCTQDSDCGGGVAVCNVSPIQQQADLGNVGTATINGVKFQDTNLNAKQDNGETGIGGVTILLTGTTAGGAAVSTSTTSAVTTGDFSFPNLLPGTYTVTENPPAGMVPTGTSFICTLSGNMCTSDSDCLGGNGDVCAPLANGVDMCTYDLSVGSDCSIASPPTCNFGNVCTGAGGAFTLGFWSNKNGQRMINASDLTALCNLHLVNANGTHFCPATKAALRTWLLNANATNMAYMLSAQLATMTLNTRHGVSTSAELFVGTPPNVCPFNTNGETPVSQNGFITVSALMNDANIELGLPGGNLLVGGSTARTCEGFKEVSLDNGNNNKNFEVPCQ